MSGNLTYCNLLPTQIAGDNLGLPTYLHHSYMQTAPIESSQSSTSRASHYDKAYSSDIDKDDIYVSSVPTICGRTAPIEAMFLVTGMLCRCSGLG